MHRSKLILAIRIFLAIVFITYGVVKIFGGQFYYGDWTIDKKTVGGTFLVWAFYGYSPMYARFVGFAELIPALMLLNRRTATAGAAALFAVSLNITVMDFGFDFPSVKYFAAGYTILAAILLWAERDRLALLLGTRQQVDAATTAARAVPPQPREPWVWTRARIAGAVATVVFVLFAGNIIGVALNPGPEKDAQEMLATRLAPGERVELKQSRHTGLYGIGSTASMEFVIHGADSARTVHLYATRTTGFNDWHILPDSIPLAQ